MMATYERNPSDFIAGTVHMSAEQKGVYSILIDLMYDRRAALDNSPKDLARICGCSTRRFIQIRDMLIADTKLLVRPDGRLSNPRFERARRAAPTKIEEKSRENRTKIKVKSNENQSKIERKSREKKPISANINDLEKNDPKNRGKSAPDFARSQDSALPLLTTSCSRDSESKEERVERETRTRACALPPGWMPPPEVVEYGIGLGFSREQVDREIEEMRDWATANAHLAKARKSDWPATLRNWMRRSARQRLQPARNRPAAGGFFGMAGGYDRS